VYHIERYARYGQKTIGRRGVGASRKRSRLGRGVALGVALVVAAGLLATLPEPGRADAPSLPPGFTSTPVITGLTLPTAMAFSPDGKVYVAQKSGLIRVYPNASTNNGTVFKDLSSRTFNNYDRGFLGLTVDPRLGDGTGHDFVYALYAKDAPPGQNPPVWSDSCPSPPGPHTDGCVVSGTLSRIPVNANGTAGAEQILIDNQWCQQFTSHSVGHLAFGPDGYLYVSGGEGASYNNADWGQFGGTLSGTPTPKNPCGDPPGGVGVANTQPTARGGSLRSQSPRRPAGEPRLLNGALLRVDPATGNGVPGNPMYDASSPSSNASRIISFGMRNPYRYTFRPGTSEIWIGDVGAGSWEEIDRLIDPTPTNAVNFGWPCLENQTRNGGFRDLDMCTALYADTANPPAGPYFAYPHSAAMNANDTCAYDGGSAISGIEFYTGTRYPAQYRNSLLFSDYGRNCMWIMTAGANGLPDPSTARTFIDDEDNAFPVDIEADPISKDIFYVNIGLGTVNRISYTSSNRAPTAAATATPTSGNTPLQVQLNASGSDDPDGDALTYSWDTDGNGSFGDATGVAPTVTYTSGGTFQVRVLVTDTGGLSATSAPVTVTATAVAGPTNTVPPGIAGSPTVGGSLSSSNGTWTGTAPITYSRQWQRCSSAGTNCADIVGATATSYTPQLGDAGSTLRVRVTATNGGGSSTAASGTVGPVSSAANTPPVPVIDQPLASFAWKAGDTINFAGHATDAEDILEPAQRLSWSIVLGHCTDQGCHQHPVSTIPGVAGGNFAAPDHEAPSYLDFTLTATDAVGATASVTRRINPRAVNLTFQTSPTGLTLAVGAGQNTAAPFGQTWVANSQVQLNAPPTQVLNGVGYVFTGWSDGGASTHMVNAPTSDRTYTATYTATSPGYILDGYGGLHTVGAAPKPSRGPYWPGWDIARGVARYSQGGGYVLDGYGGLHTFRSGGVTAPAATSGPYWSGWDIARGAAVVPGGSGGYILDGYGGLQPFALGGGTKPAAARLSGYWVGWDIARGVTFNRDGKGGYVVDAYGGLHPFAVGNNPMPPAPTSGPYWPGWDIVRGVSASADRLGGYIVDGFGGIHRYAVTGTPSALLGGPYWPGWNIVRGLAT
jgi:glucose/arabinose dehydrogenase